MTTTNLDMAASVMPTPTMLVNSMLIPHGEVLIALTDAYFQPYFEVTWDSLDSQAVGVNVMTATGMARYESQSTITDIAWHTYALSLDLDLGIGALYVDGRTAVSFPIDSTTWPTIGFWTLGYRADGTGYFEGDLDETAIFDGALDESQAYQATTGAIYATTLTVTAAGSAFIYRPLATITPTATLIAQKVGPLTYLTESTLPDLSMSMDIEAQGVLRIDIPQAPISVPFTWSATLEEAAFTDDTTLTVLPMTVAIPRGALIYFAYGGTATLVNAANVRDTTLNVIPLLIDLDNGATGTGVNPRAYYVMSAADATVGDTEIAIEDNVQFMPAGSLLYFTSDGSDSIQLTSDAPASATTLLVDSIPNDIPSGTPGSGTPTPTSMHRRLGLGPGVGSPPPPGPQPDAVVPIRRVSLNYPPPVIDGDGFPIEPT